ncbi:unnamed protein product [Pleuronectes platessa]|uniref:Uncharacterized protein n=1 Tax=Pleuronectes platessa TaxID=8262 RepID=A0A9N7YWW0_PLEPL|nr:unnamed protein product [Pleuronectes platessa]
MGIRKRKRGEEGEKSVAPPRETPRDRDPERPRETETQRDPARPRPRETPRDRDPERPGETETQRDPARPRPRETKTPGQRLVGPPGTVFSTKDSSSPPQHRSAHVASTGCLARSQVS